MNPWKENYDYAPDETTVVASEEDVPSESKGPWNDYAPKKGVWEWVMNTKTGVFHPVATAKANIEGIKKDVSGWLGNLHKEGQAIENEPNLAMKGLKFGGGVARLAMEASAEPFVAGARATALGWPRTTQALGNIGKAIGGAVSQIPISAPAPAAYSAGMTPPTGGATLGDVVPEVSRTLQQVKQEYPVATDVTKQVVSMAPFIPLSKAGSIASRAFKAEEPLVSGAASTAGDVAGAVGKGLQKKMLSGIPDSELSKYAGSKSSLPEAGLDKMVEDITKKGLDSPLGMKRMAEKTVNREDIIQKNYDRTLERYTATVHPNVDDRIDIDEIFNTLRSDLENHGPITDKLGLGLPEDIAKAISKLNSIQKDLEGRELSGLRSPHEIPKIKQVVSRDTNAFKKGKLPDPEDIIEHNMGKEVYLKTMDALNEKLATAGFPEFKAMGQEINTLSNLSRVLKKASFSGSKLTPLHVLKLIAEHGGGAYGGYNIGGLRGAIAGFVAPPVAKAIPSVLMKTGRFLQGVSTKPEIVKPLTKVEKRMRLGNIQKSEWQNTIPKINKQTKAEAEAAARAAAEAEAKRRAAFKSGGYEY